MTPAAQIAILFVVAGQPQGPCSVHLVPPNAPAAWVSAASALERTLSDSAGTDRDCREVVVRTAMDQPPGWASVEVTTIDGRLGVRRLADARDLEPTVTALIVTVPAEYLAAPPTLVAPAATTVPNGSWRLLMFAGGGARLTLPSAPSPVVDLMIGTIHRPWELALYGSWVPTVVGAGAPAKAGFSSSAELGISGARRSPFRSIDLIVGGRASAIGLWGHTQPADSRANGIDVGDPTPTFVAAPALSAFIGTSIPFLAALRLRPQVSFQWIPLGITSSEPLASIWGVGLGLGAESGTP